MSWIDYLVNPGVLLDQFSAGDNRLIGGSIIVALMATAVVFNPIPSAPIALYAGSLYGHTWGTLFIVLGALVGSMLAFVIARFSARALVLGFVKGLRVPLWLGTQNAMMTIVFLSRLLPFVSFDLMSYAAGLSTIKFWRFVIATLFGLLPASFLLAHFGSVMTASNNRDVFLWSSLILGGLILIPLIFKVLAVKRFGFFKI